MVTSRQRFQINEAVVLAELDDEAILLNVESGIYFGLDPLGTLIWKRLGDGALEDEIFEEMLDQYEVDGDKLRSDISVFLATLAANNLVRPVDG